MENNARSGKPLHPLAWIAGIAVILFSAVGVGAMMGWIPTSMGTPADTVAGADAKTTPTKPQGAPALQPRPRPPERVASNAPVKAAAQVRCAECGVIASVQEIDTKGKGTGIGAVGGAVVGGLLGNQVGGGRGQDVMTVVGAVGGAVAGNEVEKHVKSTKSYTITVRFDDGTTRTFNQTTAPNWNTGDKVKVVNGVIQSNA